MKTPSTDLFQLIKSLTSQEKKYFKQYSQRYSEERENSYTLLFDAIDAQEEYDEDKIKTKFKGHDFIKQLSVAKNYLFDKILDSLINMHRDSDQGMRLEKMISSFEILTRKNLMTSALTFFEKAEKHAIEVSKHTLLPHIARQKNQIISRIEKRFETDDLITNAENAVQHARVLLNFLEYETLSIRANILFAAPAINTDASEMKKLDELMEHPMFRDESTAMSMQAWYFYSRTKYRYLMIKGRMEEGFDLLKNSIDYLRLRKVDSREWQITNYHLYIDLLHISFHLRRYDECRRLIAEVQTFIELKYQPLSAMIQDHLRNVLLYSAETTLNLDKSIQLWEEKQQWWHGEKNKMEPGSFLVVLFSAMRLYFLKRDWQKAIFLLNEINDSKFLWDLHILTRFYWLMVQYEINNLEILKGQVHNTSEWFRKNKLMTPFEKTVFSFFEKLPLARDKKEILERFNALNDKFKELKEGDVSDRAVYYDLENWVESKITNIPFHEIVRQKAERSINAGSPENIQAQVEK